MNSLPNLQPNNLSITTEIFRAQSILKYTMSAATLSNRLRMKVIQRMVLDSLERQMKTNTTMRSSVLQLSIPVPVAGPSILSQSATLAMSESSIVPSTGMSAENIPAIIGKFKKPQLAQLLINLVSIERSIYMYSIISDTTSAS